MSHVQVVQVVQNLVAVALAIAAGLGVLAFGALLLKPRPPGDASAVPGWATATLMAQICGAILGVLGLGLLVWAFIFLGRVVSS